MFLRVLMFGRVIVLSAVMVSVSLVGGVGGGGVARLRLRCLGGAWWFSIRSRSMADPFWSYQGA